MKQTRISIIIATRNREAVLWESIEKACIATENKNVEIILINDGHLPLTIPVPYISRISCFENAQKGVSSARNLGVEKAKGEILFFIDDDMWINSEAIDWINSYVPNGPQANAVYFINWKYPPHLMEKLAATKIGRYLLSAHYHTLWGRLHKNTPEPVFGLYANNSVGSCSLVMHKKIFCKAGGYEVQMTFQGEDENFAAKLKAKGIPVYLVFDVTLYHNHSDRLEINNFLNRIYDGFGSEFNAIKAGIPIPSARKGYTGWRKTVFEFSRITEKEWILCLALLPNYLIFTPFNNKLIGALGGLQRYKQWRNIMLHNSGLNVVKPFTSKTRNSCAFL